MRQLKQKILFVLASEVDFFSPKTSFFYYSYQFIYPRIIGFEKSSVRDAVLQLCQSGEVDKIVRNRKPFFRLTSLGRNRLLSFFPISLGQQKVWDRVWRVAIIGSPEGGRGDLRDLRRQLRQLGFKKLSRGVWLTPLPISEELKDLLMAEQFRAKITVIESRRLLLGDDQQLAKLVWPLDQLVAEYNQLINEIERMLKGLKKQKELSDKQKSRFFPILDQLFSLLGTDPGLPKKLLPDDWPADYVRNRFLKLAKLVAEPQNRLDVL